ncbi:adenylate cyclase type 10-like [Coccinella septempunctata]|uniref:adenylate cyclase type 10-like n=1 Tax=Coccinella septempunctata TaxID=41139 RepID=UPI001D082FFD|nr:adenylate cyclase type 10-like [Coccinella septempunctata]
MEVKILSQHHIISRQVDQIQNKKKIEVFSSFLPDEILLKSCKSNDLDRYDGVVLLIDISDIHILSRCNTEVAKEGISIADASINAYLSSIIEVVHFYDGDIVELIPDNLIVVWKSNPEIRLYKLIDAAIACALNIQRVVENFNREIGINFQMKQVISCGVIFFAVIGDKVSKNWVVFGDMMQICRSTISTAKPNEILVTCHAWGHLNEDRYVVNFTIGGNVQIINRVFSLAEREHKKKALQDLARIWTLCMNHLEIRNNILRESKRNDKMLHQIALKETILKNITPRITSEATLSYRKIKNLEAFIIKPVLDKVKEHQQLEYLSEVCETTIQLIHLTTGDCDENEWFILINEAYCIISGIVAKKYGCVVRIKTLCHKTVLFQVVFGLQGLSNDNVNQNALTTAAEIMKELRNLKNQINVNIEIFNDLVHCSVLGHPYRKSYFVIGKRVLQEPKKIFYKILCDYKTYEYSKLPSDCFVEQCNFEESKISDEIRFEYDESFKRFDSIIDGEIHVIGRDQELGYIRNIIFEPGKSENFLAVIVKGQCKSGKSVILRKIMAECEQKHCPLAFVNLCGGKSKPYFCVSAIYSQLLDLSSHSSKVSSTCALSKKLWHFEEALQLQKSTISEDIHQSMRIFENFLQVCKMTAEFSVIVIDNIQNIDIKSLQLLEDMLKLKVIRIVGAGLFEEDKLHILWKFSLSNQFKIMDLEPLGEEFIPELICHFLNVHGVMKKLVDLIRKVCEGKPGWVQTCLLELLNKKDILITCSSYRMILNENFIFPYEKNQKRMRKNGTNLRLAIIGEFHRENLRDMSPNALTLNFFESFPSYQQIIIKTAAVIGDMFTRSLLVFILELPNNNFFTYAIKCLFDEEIFECGSKYFINNAKVISNELSCVCHMKHEEQSLFRDFPKYAFCKILHFRNRILRKIAYELLSANQKKDLHLKITELLENENALCPQCSQHRSSAIIKIKKYKDMIVLVEPPESQCASQFNIEVIKNVIRKEITHSIDEESKQIETLSPNTLSIRKTWNRTNCFCLEIMTRIYSDLVHHSQRANHLAKQIFFMYQYGSILILIGELEDAIMLLKEASQLCILSDLEKYHISVEYSKFIFSRIVTAIAEAYYHLDDFKAAKNYILLCFRQQDIPIISLEYKFCFKLLKVNSKSILDYFSTQSKGFEEYVGQTLSILMRILVAENQWNLALSVAERSINLLQRENMNVTLLCDIYSSALDICSIHGDMHTCEQLEKCVISILFQLYSTDGSMEIFAMIKLMNTLFVIKTKNDTIQNAIRIGFRLYHLNYFLHAEIFQVETVTILTDLLISVKRIEDAVHAITVTRNMTKHTLYDGDLLYFTFCIDLILNGSFYKEKIDTIENFAEKLYSGNITHIENTLAQNYLIICIVTYFSRMNNWNKMEKWKNFFRIPKNEKNDYLLAKFKLRYLEFHLLQLVRRMGYEKVISKEDLEEIHQLILECRIIGKNWKCFLPKCYIYQGYFCKLRKKSKHRKFLKLGSKEAHQNGNYEAQCWIDLIENYWKMSITNNIMSEFPFVFWKKARNISFAEWIHIMFPLPLP